MPARYEFKELLGSGSYGSVYAAWDAMEQRNVAVKRIEGVFKNDETSKRILREVTILSHLLHKHIVRVYDLP